MITLKKHCITALRVNFAYSYIKITILNFTSACACLGGCVRISKDVSRSWGVLGLSHFRVQCSIKYVNSSVCLSTLPSHKYFEDYDHSSTHIPIVVSGWKKCYNQTRSKGWSYQQLSTAKHILRAAGVSYFLPYPDMWSRNWVGKQLPTKKLNLADFSRNFNRETNKYTNYLKK